MDVKSLLKLHINGAEERKSSKYNNNYNNDESIDFNKPHNNKAYTS